MKPGILVISHGSRDEMWVKLVDAAVQEAAASFHAPVVSSFLEIVEGRLIQDGIDELEASGVTELFVVPLFVSSGSTHVDEIGQAFGLPWVSDLEGDLGTFRVGEQMKITYGPPIDDDPDIAQLLLAHIAELSADPTKESLLLIGHGSQEPVFHERWQHGLMKMATRMKDLGGFAHGEYAMLLPDQAAAKLTDMQRRFPENDVIIVPLFLSKGYFTNQVIPRRLDGLTYRYNGRAMLPHPAIERWISRQISHWLQSLGS